MPVGKTVSKIVKDIQPAGFPLWELLAAGAAKPIIEGAVNPYIGNATPKSGLIKLGAAVGIPAVIGNNSASRIVSLAVGMDGAEDLMTSLLGGFFPAIGGGQTATESDPFASAY